VRRGEVRRVVERGGEERRGEERNTHRNFVEKLVAKVS